MFNPKRILDLENSISINIIRRLILVPEMIQLVEDLAILKTLENMIPDHGFRFKIQVKKGDFKTFQL